jgi:AbrB family looped-hinge helix DNA binding protein
MRVKVSSRNQIAVPSEVRKRLQIKPGDHLLIDVREGYVVLIPEPQDYSRHLKGLHSEVWESVEPQEYVRRERDDWQE